MTDNPARTKGTWSWLFQRISAVLILVLLGLHIWLTHFESLDEELMDWENVESRVQSLGLLLIDYSLLIAVLYHALNGARMVLFDFVTGSGSRKGIDIALWVGGIFSVIWGIIIFAPILGWT